MAYRVSQPLATTPLPGDGKKKKRVTRKKTVTTSRYGDEGEATYKGKYKGSRGRAGGSVTTDKLKKVRGKDGKLKKAVVKSKTKNLDTGKTSRGKEVTRFKKDGTRTTRYKYTKGGKLQQKGKETFKGVKKMSSKSKVKTKDNPQFTKKTKTIKGTSGSLRTEKVKSRKYKGTTTKRTYKRQN